ncbi:hypothetical protein ACFQ1L_36065 [Phytohabitans flavus]|uniref:hypothetical protein n=1 Tax=Phytohabitans flavus TaxID=1076124 RepID=UPI00156406D7|nr:hypothetical protein [Phytohabitans flavus]
MITPNTLLSDSRLQMASPLRPGQRMSRPELADAINAALDRLYPGRDLTAHYVDFRWIGKLERGETRWPSDQRRAALRHVLGATTDTQLGLYVQRRSDRVQEGPFHGSPGGWVHRPSQLAPRPIRPIPNAQQPSSAKRLAITSPAHLEQILLHLREQWHALVKTDNLLGPRFALAGVLNQISVVEALRSVLRDEQRLEVVRLGAQYAESAAWLYEDAGNIAQTRYWTNLAMEWAHEGDDERMVAWTMFRRSQQAAATPNAAQAIGLAQAARRNEEQLATPTRAAIRVQEAYGHALGGDEYASQRLLDEAHTWAASDTVGDAHEGHGSYCTPGHIEIERATCWLTTGKPKKAIRLYEDALRTLPPVYQRNRAAALSRLAVAYLVDGQPEQAASTAHVALPIARSSGANRIFEEIKGIGADLAPHRPLQPVAALLDDLHSEDA